MAVEQNQPVAPPPPQNQPAFGQANLFNFGPNAANIPGGQAALVAAAQPPAQPGNPAQNLLDAVNKNDAAGFAKILNGMGRGGCLLNGRAIVWDELPGYREASNQDNSEAARILMTDWSNTDVFRVALLGDVSTGTGDGLLSRTLPQRHPTIKPWYAMECRLIEGRGAYAMLNGVPLISFKDFINMTDGKAIYEVIYRQPAYQILSDGDAADAGLAGANPTYELCRYFQREAFLSDESLSLPGQSFVWQSDGAPIMEGLAKQRQLKELHMTWHWVPDVTVQNMVSNVLPSIMSKINQFAWNDSNGDIEAVGSMLCRPPQLSKLRSSPGGTPIRDVEFVFLIRLDSTWNQFYRASIGGFDTAMPVPARNFFGIALPAGSGPPYLSADFGQLFKC